MINENESIKAPTSQNYQITIGVMFGGRSSEHEISLRSALYILKNIPQKYNILPIGISRKGEFYSLDGQFHAEDFNSYTIEDLATIVAGKVPPNSPQAKNIKSMIYPLPQKPEIFVHNLDHDFRNLNVEVSCLFPVLHGTNGEDGRMQGLFELAEIPYVGCDRVASVIGMDKDIQKRLAKEAGISVARYTTVTWEEYQENPTSCYIQIESKIGYPCFIKPNAQGSAIGAGKAFNRESLTTKLGEALKYDSKALVEELLQGSEVECAFLGTGLKPRVTTPGEIVTQDFYSYEEKYSATSHASLYIPARLSAERIAELKLLAKKTTQVLGLKGFSRIDFWNVGDNKNFIFNEVNTIPGLTSISMFPKLWEYEGICAADWIEELIETALNSAVLDNIKR